MPKKHLGMTALLPILGISLLLLWQANGLTQGIRAGLVLCYSAIIPSVFPFSVLACYCAAITPTSRESLLEKGFRRCFHLPGTGVLPLIMGLFCGFPLGAKGVAEGYRQGRFSKEEAEKLLLFTNNTGLSFLVAGVGVSMRGQIWDGVALFLIQVISSLLCGIIIRDKQAPPPRTLPPPPAPLPSFVESVKEALFGTLTVSSFVVFFSGILGICGTFLPPTIRLLVACFLEVGTACRLAVDVTGGIALTAFAISFSGVSVHLQTMAYLSDTDLSLSRYFPMKLVSGCLSCAMGCLYVLMLSPQGA